MAVNPIAENPLFAAEGLANLAHAVRRSTALYVAMSITPPESSEAELLATFERLAAALRGTATQTTPGATQPPAPGEAGFLGVNPWAN